MILFEYNANNAELIPPLVVHASMYIIHRVDPSIVSLFRIVFVNCIGPQVPTTANGARTVCTHRYVYAIESEPDSLIQPHAPTYTAWYVREWSY